MRRTIGFLIGLLVILILLFGSTAIRLFTDWLWFSDLSPVYAKIFTKIIWSKIALAAIFGLMFFVIIYTNLRIARRLAPPSGRMRLGVEDEARERIEEFLRKGLGILLLVGSLVIALFVGMQASSHWNDWLKFANATPFGANDPIFGRDIGFYVFKLPFWSYLYGWFFGSILVAAIVTGILHYLDEGLDFFANTPRFAPGVKAQLAVLLALLFFLKAAGYRLAMYNLVLGQGSLFPGAGYTDIHARLPALWILLIAAVIGGILVLLNIYRRGIVLAAAAFLGVIGLSIVVGGIYPAVVQAARVKPNEQEAERPYIGYAIENTHHAYKLDAVASRSFNYVPNLTPAQVAGNQAAIQNIRLWDYDPLKRAYGQIQVFQQYYSYNDVDIDRYSVNDTYRQVMLSARELAGPPEDADTWVNRHLRFTHGYGYVMSPVNEVTREGLPVFFASSIPVQTVPDLPLEVPQIYFGELTGGYVLVNTKRPEFDYSMEATEVGTNYSAKSGPLIGSFFRRLAFALRFGDVSILLSSDMKADSRILFRRDIKERASAIFPFLSFDSDPYLVTVNGRLYWFHDAYTTTDRYPYSQALPNRNIRYVRNPVKLVTDSYTGKVTAYMFDDSDPIIRTYAKAFPGVFRPASEMPADFRAHVRYPEDLFRMQAAIYSRYHMTNPSVFYRNADPWQIPTVGGEQGAAEQGQMEPYYIITRLPNSTVDEFVLILPLVRPGRNNMVAWMAAKCDPADYGRLIIYTFPSGRTVFGPAQIRARAEQDTTISAQLSLWRGSGSNVIHGNLLAIPIENSILYVEPLYLEATNTQIPEFKRVIVSLGDRLVMEESLEQALSALLGAPVPAAETRRAPATQPARPGAPAPPAAPTAPASDVQRLVDQANDQFNRAQEAQRKGDWAGYGREVDALKKTLGELQGRSRLP